MYIPCLRADTSVVQRMVKAISIFVRLVTRLSHVVVHAGSQWAEIGYFTCPRIRNSVTGLYCLKTTRRGITHTIKVRESLA